MAMAWALLRSTHPGPSFAVAALAAILSWGFGAGLIPAVLVVLSVLLNQFSVGLSNDAIDAPRDQEAKRSDKPVAAGDISRAGVWAWAIIFAMVSLTLAGLIHPGVLISQAVFLLAGWFYNLGLKSTVFSALAYAVGFGALPAIISYAAHPAAFPPWWSVVIAAGLGIAAHFGNVVPDREDDAAQGVRGLPQRLPARVAAGVLTGMIIVMAGVLVQGAGTQAFPASLPSAAVAVMVAVAGGVWALSRPQSRWAFWASIVASLVLAAGLTGSVLLAG